MRHACFRLAALLGAVVATLLPATAATTVKVGAYEFAPYAHIDGSMQVSGLARDLVGLFNGAQADCRFELVPTAPSRRYADFAAGKFDIIAFEDPHWEWQARKLPFEASRLLLRGGDRYVAAQRPGRGQAFFADLATKHLAGIRGYHFGFAGFNPDPAYLAAHFRIELTSSNDATIEMILSGRVDIGVVTDAYLGLYLMQHPADRGALLVSSGFDQQYDLAILERQGTRPGVAALDALIAKLTASGALDALWRRYGIAR